MGCVSEPNLGMQPTSWLYSGVLAVAPRVAPLLSGGWLLQPKASVVGEQCGVPHPCPLSARVPRLCQLIFYGNTFLKPILGTYRRRSPPMSTSSVKKNTGSFPRSIFFFGNFYYFSRFVFHSGCAPFMEIDPEMSAKCLMIFKVGDLEFSDPDRAGFEGLATRSSKG